MNKPKGAISDHDCQQSIDNKLGIVNHLVVVDDPFLKLNLLTTTICFI